MATALHEFAHGLGCQQFASLTTGALFFGQPDMFNSRLFDTTQHLYWPQLTDPQRVASAINSLVLGSSISHWDPLASRNLLMEPNINNDLTHSVAAPADLTLSLFRDIGWFADADNDGVADGPDECDSSDFGATLIVAGTNTGITNVRF